MKANTTKHERLETIAISAAKQCGRATITKQTGVFKLKEVAEKIKDYDERNPYGSFSEREGRWKPLKFAVSVSLLSTVAPERVAVESALRTIRVVLLHNSGGTAVINRP
mgnify:CR=1 FL=1